MQGWAVLLTPSVSYWLVMFGRDARGRNPTFLWPTGVFSYVPSINVVLLGLACFISWDAPDAAGYCIHNQDFLRIAVSIGSLNFVSFMALT